MKVAVVLCLAGLALVATSETHRFAFYDGADRVLKVHPNFLESQRLMRRAIGVPETRGRNKERQEKLDAFNAIDRNGNGKITSEEWERSSGTFEDFIDLLLDADANNDDEISKREFFTTDVKEMNNY
jgi:hypothetical protein